MTQKPIALPSRVEKPSITIDLSIPLESGNFLPILGAHPDSTHQKTYDLRPPLGVYNVSLGQLSARLANCCSLFEELISQHRTPDSFSKDKRHESLSDYLLLTMYAAAEHVDDLESTLLTFFPSRREFARSTTVRDFKRRLSPIRSRMSAFANAVKHQQARIRTHLIGLAQSGHTMTLVGFFIEGVHDEVVGPSKIFHSEEKVIAVPSFLWEVLIYIYKSAALLERAIAEILGVELVGDHLWSDLPRKPAQALLRLPNYSFDGAHPFNQTNVRFEHVEPTHGEDHPLYGSLFSPWSNDPVTFGQVINSYVADGVSRQFQLADPKNVNLQQWQ